MTTTTTTRRTTQARPTRDFFENRWLAIAPFRGLFAASQRLERRSPATLSRMQALLLTTTGRKSGLPRTTTLAFITAVDDLIVGSRIRGKGSDWYLNLLAQPEVTVQIGTRTFGAHAEPVSDPQRRRELVAQLAQIWERNLQMAPRPMRWLMRRITGIDYEQYARDDLEHADEMPCVVLTPAPVAAS